MYETAVSHCIGVHNRSAEVLVGGSASAKEWRELVRAKIGPARRLHALSELLGPAR